jgi:hypothetical protein
MRLFELALMVLALVPSLASAQMQALPKPDAPGQILIDDSRRNTAPTAMDLERLPRTGLKPDVALALDEHGPALEGAPAGSAEEWTVPGRAAPGSEPARRMKLSQALLGEAGRLTEQRQDYRRHRFTRRHASPMDRVMLGNSAPGPASETAYDRSLRETVVATELGKLSVGH